MRRDGTIYQKHIVCSNQGERGAHSSQDTIKENATTRTSCDARVQFSICRKGIRRVQKVVLEHNHYLASPDKRHMLRSQRRLVDADKMFISQMREAGIRPAEMYNFSPTVTFCLALAQHVSVQICALFSQPQWQIGKLKLYCFRCLFFFNRRRDQGTRSITVQGGYPLVLLTEARDSKIVTLACCCTGSSQFTHC